MSITLRSKENYCMGRMGPRLCIQTTTACNGKCYFCVGRFNIYSKTNVDYALAIANIAKDKEATKRFYQLTNQKMPED